MICGAVARRTLLGPPHCGGPPRRGGPPHGGPSTVVFRAVALPGTGGLAAAVASRATTNAAAERTAGAHCSSRSLPQRFLPR